MGLAFMRESGALDAITGSSTGAHPRVLRGVQGQLERSDAEDARQHETEDLAVGAASVGVAIPAVEQQGAATEEIARSVQQAALSSGEVTGNISEVSQAAADTGRSATEVLQAAGQVSREAEALTREVGGFIAGVRAA